MKYLINNYPVQKIVTGDTLSVTAHYFSSGSGPSCYMQANLHGPEILGSALFIQLIDFLKNNPDELIGNITIVPQANPIGVQQQIYGYQIGRWNVQNGKNWNRVFDDDVAKDSIEQKLRDVLTKLALPHDIVLDVHTAGAACVPHLYTNTRSAFFFSPLEAKAHILLEAKDFCGAFDEYCVKKAKEQGRDIHAATWEVGPHGAIQQNILQKRFVSLLHFLRSIGIMREKSSVAMPQSNPRCISLSNFSVLHAPEGGYLSWLYEPGDTIVAGNPYARAYLPKDGSMVDLTHDRSFFFLIQHPLQAVASGQEIAEIIYI